MSKISISGNNSGSGTFTIAAPDSNNNRTFSLPDEAGTALTDATDLEPQVKTSLNATGDAPLYACRSWVNFDGENTTIRDSGNVSSITDDGEGKYTVNFATAMPDGNYCAVGAIEGFFLADPDFTGHLQLFALTASSVEIRTTRNQTSGEGDRFFDSPEISIAVFR